MLPGERHSVASTGADLYSTIYRSEAICVCVCVGWGKIWLHLVL